VRFFAWFCMFFDLKIDFFGIFFQSFFSVLQDGARNVLEQESVDRQLHKPSVFITPEE